MEPSQYTDIKNPYGADLVRATSPLASPGNVNDVFATGQLEDSATKDREPAPDNPTSAEAGSSLSAISDRIWTSGWYKSHNYKPGTQGWLIEGAQGFIDVSDLRVGRLGITIIQTDTGINSHSAISVESASDASAITVLKTGLGSAFYLRQDGSGLVADILQNGAAQAMRIIAANATPQIPLQLQQNTATSTNFYKVPALVGGSGATATIQFWIANNTTPNGVLSGAKGDVCFSTDGNIYVCTTAPTTWKTVTLV